MSAPAPGVVVRVKFATRRQLRHAFQRDLSRGTLFVRTDTPLPRHECLLLVLELPDGDRVELTGEVESVVAHDDVQATSAPGMAVRLLDFVPAKREKIEKLLARARTLHPNGAPTAQLPALRSGPHLPVSAMDVLVRGLRRLIWLSGDANALGEVDYYQILGLPATATTDEIREACSILRVLLDPDAPPEGLADRLTPAQRARIHGLHALVQDIERTLTSPALRAQYDLATFSVVR